MLTSPSKSMSPIRIRVQKKSLTSLVCIWFRGHSSTCNNTDKVSKYFTTELSELLAANGCFCLCFGTLKYFRKDKAHLSTFSTLLKPSYEMDKPCCGRQKFRSYLHLYTLESIKMLKMDPRL